MMYDIPIITSSSVIDLHRYWNAVKLYHDKPHTVNRKLAGVVQCHFYKFESSVVKNLYELFSFSGILYEVRKLKGLQKKYISIDFVESFVKPYDKNCILSKVTDEEFSGACDGMFISVRILLSRIKHCDNCIEIIILNKIDGKATFYAVGLDPKKSIAPPFVYHVECTKGGNLRICLEDIEHCETNSADWLCEHLFTKLLKWAENFDGKEVFIESLSLIDLEEYYRLYHNLKDKYASTLMQMWTETTDPLKFIHEDLAIAAYLICLMQKDRASKKPSFVDVGCGNGLLVYILNQEGFPGKGIDVRSRKIWKKYPKETNLKVQTIVPSSSFCFPECDWIIGNHSDELTPWIPVIAFRSSLTTNFFVLPCCPFDFNGHKYMRVNTNLSQYTEYLQYVKQISELCGFKTNVDKLKIPSTKRTCIVGNAPMWNEREYTETDEKVADFIKKRCGHDQKNTETWVKDFQARPATEVVRNCTQLEKTFVNGLILKIATLLLKTSNYIDKPEGGKWNAGGCINLSELPKLLLPDELKRLKNECGGLKTLLKNHRYLFDVKKQSFMLRKPVKLNADTIKYRSKPCWFVVNHPDGCYYSSVDCACSHG